MVDIAIKIGIVIVLLFFYLVYFMKAFMQKKQGIQTNQMGVGHKPKHVLIIERLLVAATYSIVVVEVLSIIFDWTMLPNGTRFTGILLAIMGDVVFTLAVVTMRDNWRAGIPDKDETKLVETGIYRYSRNPAFLGFDFVYIGVLLCYFNWVLLAFTIFAIVMMHLQILQEEKFLAQAFGEEYVTYKKRVFRYLGRR